MVIEDMKRRDEFGERKYHTKLKPFNGRDALVDAYQEALDLVVYLRQQIEEDYILKKKITELETELCKLKASSPRIE